MAREMDKDLLERARNAPEMDLEAHLEEQRKLEELIGPIFPEIVSPDDSDEERARKLAKNAAIYALNMLAEAEEEEEANAKQESED